MVDRRSAQVRKTALRLCYESGMFDTAAEVDANANHPIVRDAWERAAILIDGERPEVSKER